MASTCASVQAGQVGGRQPPSHSKLSKPGCRCGAPLTFWASPAQQRSWLASHKSRARALRGEAAALALPPAAAEPRLAGSRSRHSCHDADCSSPALRARRLTSAAYSWARCTRHEGGGRIMWVGNEPSMLGSCLQGCVPQQGACVLSSRALPALSMHMPAEKSRPDRCHASNPPAALRGGHAQRAAWPCTGLPCLSTGVSNKGSRLSTQLACSLTLWPCTKGSSSTGLPPCTARLTADFSPCLQAREREGGEVRSGRGLRGARARSWVLSPGGTSHPGWATALAAQQLGGWWGGNKEGWRAQQDVCGRWAAKNRPQPGWKRVAGAPPRPRHATHNAIRYSSATQSIMQHFALSHVSSPRLCSSSGSACALWPPCPFISAFTCGKHGH